MQSCSKEEEAIFAAYGIYIKQVKLKLGYRNAHDRITIKADFLNIFGQLLKEIVKLQTMCRLMPLGKIVVKFLPASIKTREYEFRIELYNMEGNLYDNPVFYWSPPVIFDYFETDIKKFIEYLGNEPYTIAPEELLLIKAQAIRYYFAALAEVCSDTIPEIIKLKNWAQLERSDELKIILAYFSSRGFVIYPED